MSCRIKPGKMLASLQPEIVELVGDNQQALEIEKLLNQLTAECGTISPELKEKHSAEFGVIELSQKTRSAVLYRR